MTRTHGPVTERKPQGNASTDRAKRERKGSLLPVIDDDAIIRRVALIASRGAAQ